MNKIDFHLILITDRKKLHNISLKKFIDKCCQNGIKAVQLREKDLTSYDLLLLTKKLKKVTEKYSTKLLINDRLDIALLSNADGVHSPVTGIQSSQIKQFNKNLLAGKSVHSLTTAKNAEKDGFDYIICGPVFKTPSKIKYGKPLGINNLKEICSSVKIPVFTVGGINPKRAKQCLQIGAYGVAVISEIFNSKNLKQTISDFKTALGNL